MILVLFSWLVLFDTSYVISFYCTVSASVVSNNNKHIISVFAVIKVSIKLITIQTNIKFSFLVFTILFKTHSIYICIDFIHLYDAITFEIYKEQGKINLRTQREILSY